VSDLNFLSLGVSDLKLLALEKMSDLNEDYNLPTIDDSVMQVFVARI
jgi:hypothetical protein